MGAGAARLQLATYPQSPFSGPAHCCDVTDLYQAFSQRTGPGRLWISLDAPVCCPLSIDRATKKPSRKNQPKDAELQFRPVQSEGSRQFAVDWSLVVRTALHPLLGWRKTTPLN